MQAGRTADPKTEDQLKSDTRARLPCDESGPFFRSFEEPFVLIVNAAEMKILGCTPRAKSRIEVTQTHWREWSEQSKFRAAMTRRSGWPSISRSRDLAVSQPNLGIIVLRTSSCGCLDPHIRHELVAGG
jgi:hypothetical protein